MSEYSVELKGLNKVYSNLLKEDTIALKDINLQIRPGEFISIIGPSGCGKSTLLRIIGNLDKPTSGMIEYRDGADQQMGFVFQDFYLLDSLSVRENIMLPMVLDKCESRRCTEMGEEYARKFGLTHLLEKYPHELSGGEKQRTAISRALINNPDLILADEPTGNLDSKSGQTVIEALEHINQEMGKTIVMVTHDPQMASHCSRILFLKDGQILEDLRKTGTTEMFYKQILEHMKML